MDGLAQVLGEDKSKKDGYAGLIIDVQGRTVAGFPAFRTREFGSFAIQSRFEAAQDFQENLAAVMIDGKWGFIDRTGLLTMPARFEEVEAFSASLAIASDRGRSRYDRNGQTKIPGPFREATPFVHGLAAVLLSDKHVAYIDHTGKTVFDYCGDK